MFAILTGYPKILSGPVRRCEPSSGFARGSANLAARLQALAAADELVIAAPRSSFWGRPWNSPIWASGIFAPCRA